MKGKSKKGKKMNPESLQFISHDNKVCVSDSVCVCACVYLKDGQSKGRIYELLTADQYIHKNQKLCKKKILNREKKKEKKNEEKRKEKFMSIKKGKKKK